MADAFLKGARTDQCKDGTGSLVIIMRWEKLQDLVQDGRLRRYLTAASGGTSRGMYRLPNPLPIPTATRLSSWLQEERERGTEANFDLQAPFEPSGDQPQAIEALVQGLKAGKKHQTLLGATGTVSLLNKRSSMLSSNELADMNRYSLFDLPSTMKSKSIAFGLPTITGSYLIRSLFMANCISISASWEQGKTFIVANVIQKAGLPALVLAPNKVLSKLGIYPIKAQPSP